MGKRVEVPFFLWTHLALFHPWRLHFRLPEVLVLMYACLSFLTSAPFPSSSTPFVFSFFETPLFGNPCQSLAATFCELLAHEPSRPKFSLPLTSKSVFFCALLPFFLQSRLRATFRGPFHLRIQFWTIFLSCSM